MCLNCRIIPEHLTYQTKKKKWGRRQITREQRVFSDIPLAIEAIDSLNFCSNGELTLMYWVIP